MTSHTSAWKQAQFAELKELAGKYPVIAVVDLTGLPANLSSDVRKKLHESAVVKVSKTRVIKKALEDSKTKVEFLDKVEGSCGIIFTDMNPFELYGFLKKNKGSAAAKTGMLAPEDIMIPAGDTGLPPGPALSDLKNAGLKVKIEGASIAITEDAVVAKKGEEIREAVAGTLAKLDIKPIKVGLNLTVALEKGQLFLPDVLDVDLDQVFSNFVNAHSRAFKLALGVAYPTFDTMPFLISQAFVEAKALALEANVLCKATVEDLLAKANAQAKSVESVLPEAPAPAEEKKEEAKAEAEAKPEEKTEEKTEEKPAEEKKEEKPEAPAEEKKEEKPAEEKAEEKPAEAPAEEKKENA
jgi:large subunit ribosomal protein L10